MSLRRKIFPIIRLWLRAILPLVIMLAVVGTCLVSATVFLDWKCHTDIENWLPIYPNAQLVNEWHNFRERSMGITTMTLISSDTPDTIRRWYYQRRDAASQQGANHALAITKFDIHDNPDGPGSEIFLYSQCVQ